MAQGSIVKRGETYYAYWRDLDGVKRGKAVGKRKREAQAFLTKIHHEMAVGEYITPSEMLFKDFAAKWLKDYATPRYEPSTLAWTDPWVTTVLVPAIGKKHLSKVTTHDLQVFINGLGVMPSTQKRYMNTVRSMFNTAIAWGLLQKSPAAGVITPRVDHKEMQILSPDELKTFLATLPNAHRPLFTTLAYTGLRLGEALALTWSNVDLEGGTIFVPKGKSTNARRTAAIAPDLVEQLEPIRTDVGLLFHTSKGTPLSQPNVRRVFQATAVKLGHGSIEETGELGQNGKPKKHYEGLRIHDLRHTFASLMIAQGENPKLIQAMMGHASVITTFNLYGHLLPNDMQGAAERFEAAMRRASIAAVPEQE